MLAGCPVQDTSQTAGDSRPLILRPQEQLEKRGLKVVSLPAKLGKGPQGIGLKGSQLGCSLTDCLANGLVGLSSVLMRVRGYFAVAKDLRWFRRKDRGSMQLCGLGSEAGLLRVESGTG